MAWISENYQCAGGVCETAEHECCLDVGVCKADSVSIEDDDDVSKLQKRLSVYHASVSLCALNFNSKLF